MKKIFLLCSILTCFLAGYSQTLSSPSPVYSNDASVLITVQGESRNSAIDLQSIPVLQYPITINSPSNQALAGNISLYNIQVVSYYNPSTGTKSSFTAKITNVFASPINATFTFTVYFINLNTSTSSPGNITYTVTINPGSAPPTSFPSAAASATFTKNSCGVGFIGSKVTYALPAGKYTASTQGAADQLAQNDINANGQNYANANGTCTAGYYNQIESATYTRNNCTVGTMPTSVIYTVNANTYIGATQAAANQLALNDITANGQAYANTHGGCSNVYIEVVGVISGGPSAGSYREDIQLRFSSTNAGFTPLTISNLSVSYLGPLQSTRGGGPPIRPTHTIVVNNVQSVQIASVVLATKVGEIPTAQSPSSLGYNLVASPNYTFWGETP